jgi:hypothetical protein
MFPFMKMGSLPDRLAARSSKGVHPSCASGELLGLLFPTPALNHLNLLYVVLPRSHPNRVGLAYPVSLGWSGSRVPHGTFELHDFRHSSSHQSRGRMRSGSVWPWLALIAVVPSEAVIAVLRSGHVGSQRHPSLSSQVIGLSPRRAVVPSWLHGSPCLLHFCQVSDFLGYVDPHVVDVVQAR